MKKKLCLMLGLLACAPAWGGNNKEEVSRLLRKTVDEVLSVIHDRALARQEKKDRIMTVVTPVFDFELMGKLALGRKYWPTLTDPQRREYLDLFVKQLQSSYLDKVELVADQKQKMIYEDPVEKDGKVSVMTRVVTKSEPIKLRYRFYKKAETWMVFDVEIQDVSLVKSYGLQYQQVLQKGTVEDLLAKMKLKIEQMEKAGPPAAKT